MREIQAMAQANTDKVESINLKVRPIYSLLKKAFLSMILFSGGVCIFILGNPYYRVFPTNGNRRYYLGITLFFLCISIVLWLVKSTRRYWRCAYSMFTASAALLFLSTGVLNLTRRGMPALQDLAFDKLSQFLHVVPVILLLTFVVTRDLKSIYLARGNFKQGIIFGSASFILFALIAFSVGSFSSGFITNLLKAAPWILIFITSNAIMEELWFRGIFLGPYESLVGRIFSILITSLIFGIAHINATYEFPGGGYVFGMVVFCLGAVGAWLIYKTNSILGAVLFHAGYDLVIIGSVLASS